MNDASPQRWVRFRTFVQSSGLASRLFRGGAGSLAMKGASILLNLSVTLVLARLLGASGFGQYSFVFAAISLVVALAQAGLPLLVVREVAKAEASHRPNDAGAVTIWSLQLGVLLGLILTALISILVWISDASVEENLFKTALWGIAIIPVIIAGNIIGAALQGTGRVVLGQAQEMVVRPAVLVGVAALAMTASPAAAQPHVAMAIHTSAVTVALLWAASRLASCLNFSGALKNLDRARRSSWLRAVLPLGLIAAMQMINLHVGVLVLGMTRSPEEVGIFRAVVQTGQVVALAVNALDIAISPTVASLYARDKLETLQKVLKISAYACFALAVPAGLICILAGQALLSFVFGQGYAAGSTALAVLAVGQIINAFFGAVGVTLIMTGHERATATAVTAAALANITLNLILVPVYGLIGAAIASATALAVWNVVQWAYTRLKIGVDTSAAPFIIGRGA